MVQVWEVQPASEIWEDGGLRTETSSTLRGQGGIAPPCIGQD